jgi:hypothetical protein
VSAPKAFISYSWDDLSHRTWVRDVAARLRADGVETILDRWHAVPGDQLPAFMERAIRESDFVLIVCTPKYKLKSDGRVGGAGYEGDIIQSEVFVHRNHHKFIPILRAGKWNEAAPSALQGKYKIDLRDGIHFESNYEDLLRTLHREREQPPVVGCKPDFSPSDSADPVDKVNGSPQRHRRTLAACLASAVLLAVFVVWQYRLSHNLRSLPGSRQAPVTDSRGNGQTSASSHPDVSPTLQPSSVPQRDRRFLDERQEIRARLEELQMRVTAMDNRWKPVLARLQSMDQSLQPDITTALGRLKLYTRQAEEALTVGDAIRAQHNIDLAEKQLVFLNQQQPE